MSIPRLATVLLVLAALGCHRARPQALRDAPAPRDSPGLSLCTRVSARWVLRPEIHPRDAAEALGSIESALLRVDAEGRETLLWSDRRDNGMTLARPSGPRVTRSSGPTGEHSDAVMAEGFVARVVQSASGRSHNVWHGHDLSLLCEQPEGMDEGFSLSLAGVGARERPSVLLVWDEPGHQGDAGMNAQAPPGTIYAQVISGTSQPLRAGAQCPSSRALSGSDQDAEDPLAVSLPDGGAAVFWWSSRGLASPESNDTLRELWGLRVSAEGRAVHRALRLTNGALHRFGLSAAVSGDGRWIWLVMREGAESGSEARGDGGDVVALRVDAMVTSVGAAVTLTLAGSNPTGAPTVIAGRAGAEVWWQERRDGSPVTFRRALGASGEFLGDPQDEPALTLEGADLPRYARGAERVVLLRAGGRGVGVGSFRCGSL